MFTRASRSLALFLLCLAGVARVAECASGFGRLSRAVVKVYVTFQRDDFSLPWQGRGTSGGTGTGFIINKRRILTNAHVVSDAKFLQVQRHKDAAKFDARVRYIGHDCDLALLEVDDPAFFEGTSQIEFAKDLPALNDEVQVLGYPLGGTRLSITRGVVSRIDYSVYTHSGVDSHLVLQVDAAINPGNSGGPVLLKGKAVGLAFQGLTAADNIGYAIPTPVIRHFLDDVEDGSYHGYPELGAAFLDARNPALRRDLKLPVDRTGVVVSYLDPFGSGIDRLQPRDVLLSIDGYSIDNDGTVEIDGNNVLFAELLERKQCGDAVDFQVWRGGAEALVRVPLKTCEDPFIYRNVYDERPRFFVLGGLVFSPLTRAYLQTLQSAEHGAKENLLYYYAEYAKLDKLHVGRDEFVVLIRRLPHPVNTYADGFVNRVLSEINGVKLRGIQDMKRAIAQPLDGFHVLTFMDSDETLVLDAGHVRAAQDEIAQRYLIPASEFLGDTP